MILELNRTSDEFNIIDEIFTQIKAEDNYQSDAQRECAEIEDRKDKHISNINTLLSLNQLKYVK